MKHFSFGIIFLALFASDVPPLLAKTDWEREDREKERLLAHLRPVLESFKGSIRFYYAGPCKLVGPLASFPHLKLRSPKRGKRGVAAIRDIFRDDKRVTIKQTQPDIVRIYVGNAAPEILQTKIPLLRFKPKEQYTAELAVLRIETSKELERAMHRLRLVPPAVVIHCRVFSPDDDIPNLPHLPRSISNFTLDQAYDLVAKVFDITVLFFESCTNPDGSGSFNSN